MSRATLTVGVGLEGDRYANAGDEPGVVSLIAREDVDAFNEATGLGIAPESAGRNILTQGVDLNALVGRTFRVGGVLLEGFEPCDPCASLGAKLATDAVSATQVVRAFMNRAGLRAYVRSSGPIESGSAVTKDHAKVS